MLYFFLFWYICVKLFFLLISKQIYTHEEKKFYINKAGCPVQKYIIWKLILNSPNNQYMPYGYFHYGVCLKFQVLNIDEPMFCLYQWP